MHDRIVQRTDLPVAFVRAEGGPAGSERAFEALEARLDTLRGRKFYATCRGSDDRACVAIHEDDDPQALGLETGVIRGGPYARRRLQGGWQDIGPTFAAMAADHDEDPERPCVEFHRRHDEVHLLLPVRERASTQG
ncbi:MAG: hypothetical protein ACYTG6_11735 [Planctomycetota bacterium]